MIESDRELSSIMQELWDSDVNRLQPGKDYMISLQVRDTQTHLQLLSLYFKNLMFIYQPINTNFLSKLYHMSHD